MASLFGLPIDSLTKLALDPNAETKDVRTGSEMPLMVGGRYDEKHRDIFQLFNFSVSEAAEEQLITQTLIELIAICPVFIIFVCQIGFALVQSGASRTENAALPFLVNLLNFSIACVSYWGVGYAVSRSKGLSVLGYNHWFGNAFDTRLALDWTLHLGLTLISTNIASFGGLERCQLWVYCLVALPMSGLVQSLAIHWAWYSEGWMLTTTFSERAAYHDFGGSGVIYITGGSAALVMSCVLGHRRGRSRRLGSRRLFSDIEGHSVPLEMMGGYLLFICYACANCVRALTTCIDCDPVADVGAAIMNTMVAGATSGLTTLVIIFVLNKILGQVRFQWVLSRAVMGGTLCGTVAVAAGCNMYQSWVACVVGVTAGCGYVIWSISLYASRAADDPVGTVAVHLGGGLWGVCCVKLFHNDTGLLFASNISAAGLALLWNVLGGMVLGVVSGAVVGGVLMIPKMLNSIPLGERQEQQGMDLLYMKQQAYPYSYRPQPFHDDIIKDHDQGFGSRQSISSPTSYSLTLAEAECPDGTYLQYQPDCTVPVQEEYTWAPSYTTSPTDQSDKRVWFVNDLQNNMNPESTPLQSRTWDDIEMY